MSRATLPCLICLGLAFGGLALAQQPPAKPALAASTPAKAAPKLEDRIGKTITVFEAANKDGEKAVILQVWKLEDGRACMQAHSLKSGEPLTIVEDAKAKPDHQFTVFRWKADGTAPAGCPLPPATAQVANQQPILQASQGAAQPASAAQTPATSEVKPAAMNLPAQQTAMPTPAQQAKVQQAPAKPLAKLFSKNSQKAQPAAQSHQQSTQVVAKSAVTGQPVAQSNGTFGGGLFPPAAKEETVAAPAQPVQNAMQMQQPATTTAPVQQAVIQPGTVMNVTSSQPAIKVETKPMQAMTMQQAMPIVQAQPITQAKPMMQAQATQPAKPLSPYAQSAAPATATAAKASPYAAGNATVMVTTAGKSEAMMKTVSSTKEVETATGPAPAAPVKVSTAGRQIVVVNEGGVDRQCVVLGEDRVGGHVNGIRVQAVDNGECFTLACCRNIPAPVCTTCTPTCTTCTTCTTPCPAPCATPCPAPCATPCPAPCPPVKCEVVKPCPAPCPTPCPAPCPPVKCEEIKPCPAPCATPCPTPCPAPCPPVKCETVKPCDPCAKDCGPCAKPCDTCKSCDSCSTCNNCMDRGSCYKLFSYQPCSPRPGLLDNNGCGNGCCDKGNMLPVPVPHMGLCGMKPGCSPAMPCIEPYNTMESPAMRAFYRDHPAYGVSASLQIYKTCAEMQRRIGCGINACYNDPAQAEAVKNTIFLMAVLQKSQHVANRTWAAERLQEVKDESMKPFAVEVLVGSCLADPVPAVRVAALASLSSMKADTPAVREMLAYTSRDMDPMVRKQAQMMVAVIAGQNKPVMPVQQAGAVTTADYNPSPARGVMDR